MAPRWARAWASSAIDAGADGGGQAVGAAGPAGGHADGAVPQAGALDVEAGPADGGVGRQTRRSRWTAPVAVAARAGAVPHGWGRRVTPPRVQRDEEQLLAIGGVGGQQGGVEQRRAGAEALRALQAPAARPALGDDAVASDRFDAQTPSSGAGRGGAAGLGQDGDGVGVGLGQPGHGEVLGGGQRPQRREARPGWRRHRGAGGRAHRLGRQLGAGGRRRQPASASSTSHWPNPPVARVVGAAAGHHVHGPGGDHAAAPAGPQRVPEAVVLARGQRRPAADGEVGVGPHAEVGAVHVRVRRRGRRRRSRGSGRGTMGGMVVERVDRAPRRPPPARPSRPRGGDR